MRKQIQVPIVFMLGMDRAPANGQAHLPLASCRWARAKLSFLQLASDLEIFHSHKLRLPVTTRAIALGQNGTR